MKKLLSMAFVLAVASATTHASAQGVKGDAVAGERKNAMCIGCHGIEGFHTAFPEIYRVPKISGQTASYIVAALKGYKDGTRKHPSMRGVTANLTDQDMLDLAAYYSGHGGGGNAPDTPAAQPTAKAAALMQAAACASCHGANFNTPLEGNPKIAGQNRDFLQVAAKSYLNPDKPMVGRSSPIMVGVLKAQREAAGKDFDIQLKETLDYIAQLPGDLKTIQQKRIR